MSIVQACVSGKLVNPERVAGDTPIDGFVLDLIEVWG
jgi:hypothetical protein